jgi:hypothetical protein
LAAETLAHGVTTDEPLDLGHELVVAAECEAGINLVLECDDSELLETCRVGLRERFGGEISKRRASPQGERLIESRARTLGLSIEQVASSVCHELLKALEIELRGLDAE